MAKQPRSKQPKSKGSASYVLDSKTGRFVSKEAAEFSRRFTKQYREALHELSKH